MRTENVRKISREGRERSARVTPKSRGFSKKDGLEEVMVMMVILVATYWDSELVEVMFGV